MVELAVFLLIISPGVLLATSGSSYLVDYTIFVFVFNRGIRRLVDYENHQFNPFSLISLTPLVMLGLLSVSFIWKSKMLHRRAQQIFLLMLGAIAYGLAVGILRNGLSGMYQGAEYLSTIGIMGYVATSPANDATADRWLRTAGLAGVLAALYGWYQYLVVPDWDAFWVQQVGFVGYLGKLEPTKMTVFSTFAERGVCAAYLGLVAVPMLVARRWRVAIGWPEVLLLLSCIFLTFARSGIIVVVLGAALYPILNRGKNTGRIVIIAALVVAVLSVTSSAIPGADRIMTRFESLFHMQDDGSFKGRLVIAQATLPAVIQNPAGYGIGSSGLAQRLNGQTSGIVSDNGWLELMGSLGLPGCFLFGAAVVLIWRYLADLKRLGVQDDYLGLARTYLVVALIVTWAGNYFIDFSVMWIALGRVLSPLMFDKIYPEFREIVESPTAEAISS